MINFVQRIWKWYMIYFERITTEYKIIILLLALCVGVWLFICTNRNRLNMQKAIVIEILFCYLLFVFTSTVFARESVDTYQVSLDVIQSYRYKIGYNIDTQFELLLNVLLLLPFGIMFPDIIKTRRVVYTLSGGFVLSVLIEGLQFVLKKGTFELTDIINNSLGVLLGCLLCVLVRKCKYVIITMHNKKENSHV